MRIIIPMAGHGTRLRPHSLVVPKPLVVVAGKPIVQWLVEDLAEAYGDKIDEIAFIIGDFGKQVENDLLALAERVGSKGSIYYQREKLGTAHAIMCAKESLQGRVIVAFADTIFHSSSKLPLNDANIEGSIWVQRVENPSAYGVIKTDADGNISEFVEKPQTFVSDMAIIGVYYFRSGEYLRSELQYLLDNDIRDKGEYQLTNALENMKQKGSKFRPLTIDEWLDCGNKNAVLYANERVLLLKRNAAQKSASAVIENSTIIEPCFIGEGAVVRNSVVGPFVSLGNHAKVEKSVISNSILQQNATVHNAVLHNSMLGSHTEYNGHPSDISLGDYSKC